MNTPENWKRLELGDLLNDTQLRVLTDLIRNNPEPEERLRAIKQYLNSIHEDLEDKGVLPDFLAYVLEFRIPDLIRTDWSNN